MQTILLHRKEFFRETGEYERAEIASSFAFFMNGGELRDSNFRMCQGGPFRRLLPASPVGPCHRRILELEEVDTNPMVILSYHR
jgi:hypothetical protein